MLQLQGVLESPEMRQSESQGNSYYKRGETQEEAEPFVCGFQGTESGRDMADGSPTRRTGLAAELTLGEAIAIQDAQKFPRNKTRILSTFLKSAISNL